MRIRIPESELLRDRDLRRFWAGETVSLFGSQVSVLALPLAAVLVLGATPVELGVLRAAEFLPFLLFALPAGAYIDRARRRPVLLGANLGRAAVLAVVPVAAVVGALDLRLLVVVTLVVGVLTVLFEVAYLAYVPALVDVGRLAAANSRLQASSSAADIGGPGLAGLLIGLVGAPIAIAVDALSFLVSGLAIASIRTREAAPMAATARPGVREAIVEGLAFVARHAILRALAGEAAMFNLLFAGLQVAFLLFATRELGFDATTIGLAFSVGSAGSLVGSLAIGRLSTRLGYGRALTAMMVLGTLPFLAVPVFAEPGPFGFVVVAASYFVAFTGIGAVIVLVVTLRQTIVPPGLLGRAAATYRMLTWGIVPIGAIMGGFLVEAIGARGAILVTAAGIALAPIWIFLSPIPRLATLGDALPAASLPAELPVEAASQGEMMVSLQPFSTAQESEDVA